MTLTVSISDFEQMTMMKHRDKPLEKQYLQLTNCFITLSSQVRVPLLYSFSVSAWWADYVVQERAGQWAGRLRSVTDRREEATPRLQLSHCNTAALQYCSQCSVQRGHATPSTGTGNTTVLFGTAVLL